MALYPVFKTDGKLCEETAFVRVYRLESESEAYKIVVTKRHADRHTVIHCVHNRIAWEQVPRFPRLTGRNYGEKVPIYMAVPEKNSITLFVVKGKPGGFVGLDEGVFRCADNWDDDCINVMSHKRFMRM